MPEVDRFSPGSFNFVLAKAGSRGKFPKPRGILYSSELTGGGHLPVGGGEISNTCTHAHTHRGGQDERSRRRGREGGR